MRSRVGVMTALVVLASGVAPSPAWAAAPGNDNFADAQGLGGSLPITATGTNVEATAQPGEPDHNGSPAGNSVWYAWTPTESSVVSVDTCGSTFDTVLAIYTGATLDALFPVASNDDACEHQSRVQFTAEGGTTYRIAVDGFFGEQGAIALTIAPPPPNVGLDTTFNPCTAGQPPPPCGGLVTTDFGIDFAPTDIAAAIAVDGKIVAVGTSSANEDFTLARYNPDGSLDSTFGTGGIVITDISGSGSEDEANAVVLQGGKVVVVGTSDDDFAVARYNPDGSLDTSFDTDGRVTTDVSGTGSFDVASAVALQEGKIVVVGTSEADFAVARYNSDGSLDAGFGSVGTVTTDFLGGNFDAARAVAAQSGKIVAAGFSVTEGFSDATENSDFALARYNSDGSLDTGFGAGGTVITNFSGSRSSDFALAVAFQSDGRIVAAGSSGSPDTFFRQDGPSDFAVARYTSNGSLDAGFGIGGKVTTDFPATGSHDVAFSVAIQGDAKIVAAGGSSATGNGDFAVARYNPDGSLDRRFGQRGTVTTDFCGCEDSAFGVAIQNDGKIVAAGGGDARGNIDFALVRYKTDGNLDRTFGSAGKVITDFPGSRRIRRPTEGHAMALQTDGKIVVAGYDTGSDSFTADAPAGVSDFFECGDCDFVLARYNPDGSLDTGFGTDGKVTTDFFGGEDRASAVTIDRDKVVVAGFATSPATGTTDFAVARYKPDGSLDTGFGNGGKVTTNFSGFSSDRASAVAIQSGKIVVGGTSDATGADVFALARFKSNGALDTGFGTRGKVTTDVAGFGFNELTALAVQGDGKLVAAGFTIIDDFDFALVRYTPNGTLDQGFGIGGKVTTHFSSDDIALALALQSDGKIVVAGMADSDIPDFALARYTSNGFLDPTFGEGGRVTTHFPEHGFSFATALAVQNDGKLVAAGVAGLTGGDRDFAVARYNPSGCLDVGFGTGGTLTTDFSGSDSAFAVALQSDGKIVAAGVSDTSGSNDFALARYLPGDNLGTECGF